MSVSPKKRFAVMQRDGFTCQYCGASYAEAPLCVDHIRPRAKGGKDVMWNLATACYSCNIGKGAERTTHLCSQCNAGPCKQEKAEAMPRGEGLSWGDGCLGSIWEDLLGYGGGNP